MPSPFDHNFQLSYTGVKAQWLQGWRNKSWEPTQQKGPSPPPRCRVDETCSGKGFPAWEAALNSSKTWGDISWLISGCMVAGDGKWRWADGRWRGPWCMTTIYDSWILQTWYCGHCSASVHVGHVVWFVNQGWFILIMNHRKLWHVFCSQLVHISFCFNERGVLLYLVSSNHSTYHQLTSPQIMASVQIFFPCFSI